MISLRKSLSELENLSSQLKTILNYYAYALASVEQHAVEISAEDATEHRTALRLIRKKVEDGRDVENLEECSVALDAELRRYSRRAGDMLRDTRREVREILEIMGQAAQAMTARSDRYSTEFGKLAKDLETVGELEDLGVVRKRLSTSVSQLRNCTDSMQRDDRATVVQLQSELRTFQRRLQEAESLAATDALTGLINRREAERLMARKIEAGRAFCIMLFDLDGFKAVNDRYGHHVGDHLLKAFAERLTKQFRSDDVVCRWGGDEFLVVLSLPLPDGIGRARSVADRVGGLYAVQTAKGAVNISVQASAGMAQHEPGESGEELFSRADAYLYEVKRERQPALVALNESLVASAPKA